MSKSTVMFRGVKGDEVASIYGPYMSPSEQRKIQKGETFDLLCDDGLNYHVEVKEVKENGTGLLHFRNWSTKWDYKGPLDVLYLAPRGTYSEGISAQNSYVGILEDDTEGAGLGEENDNDGEDGIEGGITKSSLRSGGNNGKEKDNRRGNGKHEGKSTSHVHNHDFFSGQTYPDDFLAKPRLKQKSRRRDTPSNAPSIDVAGLIKDEYDEEDLEGEGDFGDEVMKKRKIKNDVDEFMDDDSSSSGGGGGGGGGGSKGKSRSGNGNGNGKSEVSHPGSDHMTLKIRRSVSPKLNDSNTLHDIQGNKVHHDNTRELDDQLIEDDEQGFDQGDDDDDDDDEYEEDEGHYPSNKKNNKGRNQKNRKAGSSTGLGGTGEGGGTGKKSGGENGTSHHEIGTSNSGRTNGNIVFKIGRNGNGVDSGDNSLRKTVAGNNFSNNPPIHSHSNSKSSLNANKAEEHESVIKAFAAILRTSNSIATINEARSFARANLASFEACRIDINQILELLNAKWCIDNAITLILGRQ